MNVKKFVERVPESQGEARTVIESIGSAVAALKRKADDVRLDRRFTAAGHRERVIELSRNPQELCDSFAPAPSRIKPIFASVKQV